MHAARHGSSVTRGPIDETQRRASSHPCACENLRKCVQYLPADGTQGDRCAVATKVNFQKWEKASTEAGVGKILCLKCLKKFNGRALPRLDAHDARLDAHDQQFHEQAVKMKELEKWVISLKTVSGDIENLAMDDAIESALSTAPVGAWDGGDHGAVVMQSEPHSDYAVKSHAPAEDPPEDPSEMLMQLGRPAVTSKPVGVGELLADEASEQMDAVDAALHVVMAVAVTALERPSQSSSRATSAKEPAVTTAARPAPCLLTPRERRKRTALKLLDPRGAAMEAARDLVDLRHYFYEPYDSDHVIGDEEMNGEVLEQSKWHACDRGGAD